MGSREGGRGRERERERERGKTNFFFFFFLGGGGVEEAGRKIYTGSRNGYDLGYL